MKISDIYKEYGIPKQLQNHMLRVASCAKLIINNWLGPDIDETKILKVLLLHDMGNIVKIKEECLHPQFIFNKEKYYKMYGNDDHKISLHIAKELGLNPEECNLMANKIFVNNASILKSNDFELKISAYCDQRVAPNGVLPILDRLNEAKLRYADKPGSSMNNPQTDLLIQYAQDIEKQIFKHCTINPQDINDETIKTLFKNMKDVEIENN